MPHRHELTDAEWARLRPLLPPHQPGRPRQEGRRMLKASRGCAPSRWSVTRAALVGRSAASAAVAASGTPLPGCGGSAVVAAGIRPPTGDATASNGWSTGASSSAAWPPATARAARATVPPGWLQW